jgi:hypothetical protein
MAKENNGKHSIGDSYIWGVLPGTIMGACFALPIAMASTSLTGVAFLVAILPAVWAGAVIGTVAALGLIGLGLLWDKLWLKKQSFQSPLQEKAEQEKAPALEQDQGITQDIPGSGKTGMELMQEGNRKQTSLTRQ